MAEGDEYLDYLDETLERATNLESASLGVFLETKWRVLKSLKRSQQTGGRWVIRSLIHLALVLSRVHNNEE